MRVDFYTKAILTVIALLLAVIAFRPIVQPQPVAADGAFTSVQFTLGPGNEYTFFDTRTGDLWSVANLEQWDHKRVAQFGKELEGYDPKTGARLY